jgi:hypothetical protein
MFRSCFVHESALRIEGNGLVDKPSHCFEGYRVDRSVRRAGDLEDIAVSFCQAATGSYGGFLAREPAPPRRRTARAVCVCAAQTDKLPLQFHAHHIASLTARMREWRNVVSCSRSWFTLAHDAKLHRGGSSASPVIVRVWSEGGGVGWKIHDFVVANEANRIGGRCKGGHAVKRDGHFKATIT